MTEEQFPRRNSRNDRNARRIYRLPFGSFHKLFEQFYGDYGYCGRFRVSFPMGPPVKRTYLRNARNDRNGRMSITAYGYTVIIFLN